MSGTSAFGDAVTTLIVPGIGNSGPKHWQTLWERQHSDWRRVQQRDWDRPICEEWVRRLDDAIRPLSTPPVLIAHSLGCLVSPIGPIIRRLRFAQRFWWQSPIPMEPASLQRPKGFSRFL